MPTYTDPVDLDIIDVNAISEEELSTPAGMNKFANSVITSIEDAVTDTIGAKFDFNRDYSENYIMINNRSLNAILNKYETSDGKTLTLLQRNKVAPLLVAQSLLHGEDVSVFSPNDNKLTLLNDKMKDHILPEALSLWERFLAFFGLVNKDRVAESEKVNYVTQHIDALISDAKTNNKEYNESIVQENQNTATAIGKKYADFHTNRLAQESQLNEQYFSKMNPLAFRDGVKKESNLISASQITTRNWNTLTLCAMMSKGYSLKQACDPSFTEGREQVGIELSEISVGLQSEYKEINMKAGKKLADIYFNGANKYLDQPVPDIEELKNFTESKDPYYMFKSAQLGYDLLNPFSFLRKYMLEDPSNAIIPEVASNAAMCGIFYPISISAQMPTLKNSADLSPENKRLAELNYYSSILGAEITRKFSYDRSDNTATTIREYVQKNEPIIADTHALHRISPAYANSYLNGRHGDVQKVSDILNDKTSFYETIPKSVQFKNALSSFTYIRDNYCGTFGQITARADLAKNVIDKIGELTGVEYTQKQKLKLATNLVADENFKSKTNLEPEKIKELINDPGFLKTLIDDAALKASVNDKANDAEKSIAASTSTDTEKQQDSLAKKDKSKGASTL